MAHKPINRENEDDLLRQIGRTEEKIAQHNRAITKFDNEIGSWEKRKEYLEKMKKLRQAKISEHQNYINQLEGDLQLL